MDRPTGDSRFSWMLPAMLFVAGVSPRAAAQASQPAQSVGHGGEAPWASDRQTGCTASLRDLEKIDAQRYSDKFFLTWTGACKSGKLDGYGTLTIWNDSILTGWLTRGSGGGSFVSRMEMTPESGLRMNDGVLSSSVQASDLRIEVAQKSETPVYAAVAIYRKRKTPGDYRYRATILAVARSLQAALPSLGLPPNNSNVVACIKDEGDDEQPPQLPGEVYHHCEAGVALQRYPQDSVNVRRVRVLGGGTRDEWGFQLAAARLVNDSLRTVWTAELAARGETPASYQAELRAQYFANLRDQFAKKYGVQAFPKDDDLMTNPFNYQGKTVGTVVVLEGMSTPTTGQFSPGYVVSGIPTGTFAGHDYIVLAGRVVGRAANGLVQLTFIGMQPCGNERNQSGVPDCVAWVRGDVPPAP